MSPPKTPSSLSGYMTVRISLPYRELATHADVVRIIAETATGSYGLLPRRLDTVMVIVPGILTIETASLGEFYVAVDEGTLVKAGADVLVSVRRAREGTDLETLRDAVHDEYLSESHDEHEMRAVMSKLETGFLKRFADLRHD